jgi:hypothetical protein
MPNSAVFVDEEVDFEGLGKFLVRSVSSENTLWLVC